MSVQTVPEAAAGYRVERISVDFPSSDGTLRVLTDVSLTTTPGEIIGIVGRSGTGKTTLLRVLAGLLPATSGSLTLNGSPIDGPPSTAVAVFQDYTHAVLPWRSVARNVALGLEGRTSRSERSERVSEALRMVGLDDRANDYPWRLSGGMQQRVQIARALVVRPSVLLMDEPFGALDALTKAALQDELLRLHEQLHATVIFITHDLEEAIYLSDRVMVISGQPGEISRELPTALPRPRDQITTRELPRYLEVRHELAEALRSES